MTSAADRIMETLSETTGRLMPDRIARDTYYLVLERTLDVVISAENRRDMTIRDALTDVVNEEQPE